MVSGRPLLYLSLPGVAFILGVFWFRRRNKNRLDSDVKCTKTTSNGGINKNGDITTLTKSININGTSNNDDENRIFCKSAPIQIVQNRRGTSPVKQSQQQIDSEILKSKIQDAEHKFLTSIDEDFENLSSSVDLPGSVDNRKLFYSRNVDITKDNPVVIVATITPKISPEHSFLETKYTKECEKNNNSDKEKTVKNDPNDLTKTSNNIEKTEENVENITKSVAAGVDKTNDNTKKLVSNGTKTDENTNKKCKVNSASPSSSLCSVQSGDSGKGSSLPRSEAARAKTTYEFFLPNSLVGHLYGSKYSYINYIKSQTNAIVLLRRKLYTGKLRVCAVEGTESEVQAALVLIRQRLPINRYPNLTMQKINFTSEESIVPLSAESMLNIQLNLIEGINNDVVVSAVISGGHIFVQHPLHPTHPSIAMLQKCLYESYSVMKAPLLPGIELSAVCVMPVSGIWYRVQIVDQDKDDADRCIVKFLDFGGYMNVHFGDLRQIRSDFMSVPFQATECVLSNIEPIDACWSAESADILLKLTKGIVLQAQVAGYNEKNIPEVYLFACLGPNNVIFINKELVARNLAKWVDIGD